jgi:5'(3')-deoxyribonucleotidase
MKSRKIVYVDMDNVLVDFKSGIQKLTHQQLIEFEERYDEVPGIFGLMDPMENAIESFVLLSRHCNAYILSTSPWNNDTAASDKVRWVKKHLGEAAHKRLILSHHKQLNKGDFLIDDRTANGAGDFEGEHIHFGTPDFPDWKSVCRYLLENKL